MSLVPLPWWTSQSTISTRRAPSASRAWRAATATLLMRQKPIPISRLAWWPGGRAALKATSASPPRRASTIAQAPPAACSAAVHEPALIGVSGSSAPPPASLIDRTVSRCAVECTALRASTPAAGATRRA